MQPLPIDELLPDIVASLQSHRNLVIEAAPGAGKTTRVPPALLQSGSGILVLEPRRLAARLAARRVAEERGEAIGQTVGYQVRFEDVSSPRTRLRFLTEGVLNRRLLADPELRGIHTVILDEFHERHLETDLALALLLRLQKTLRPDLRLVIMSATLEAAPVSRLLGGCPTVASSGRLFGLTIEHTAYSPAPIEQQVAAALDRILARGLPGDILAFLPGAAEIRNAERACAALARRHDLLVAPLHGSLSPTEQDLAVAPSPRRKLILATNLAESSITIDGVRVVIDSGFARVARDSAATGLPALELGRISQASAKQRAGRAARTGPGWVVRLYTAEDFHRRPAFDQPEILRRELSQLCLQLQAMEIPDPAALDWIDPPPALALEAAQDLLRRLRATAQDARRLAALPLHPRLARMVLDAETLGAGTAACLAAAWLSSGDRLPAADLLRTLDLRPEPRTQATLDQIHRAVRPASPHGSSDEALSRAVLAAFPDRVGRRRPGGYALLSNGASAQLPESPSEFFTALDIEQRSDRPLPEIRLVCPLQPDWLLDLFPDRISERARLEWNTAAERVDSASALLYDQLVLDETRGGAPEPVAAAELLTDKILETGLDRFLERESLDELLARIGFAARHSGRIAPPGPGFVRAAVREACAGLRSFADFRPAAQGVLRALESAAGARLLAELAPVSFRLPSGRQARIRYEEGKAPWLASRLQDFFGIRESPRIAAGRVPLTLHLLAPNQRAVQTTSDLAGFWERLYPQVRKELSRRYPRHSWPEKPN